MKKELKIFVDLSIIIGIFFSILTFLAFNRNWIDSESQRVTLIMGILTAVFIGVSLLPKCRGLFIFVISLIFVSFTYIFFK